MRKLTFIGLPTPPSESRRRTLTVCTNRSRTARRNAQIQFPPAVGWQASAALRLGGFLLVAAGRAVAARGRAGFLRRAAIAAVRRRVGGRAAILLRLLPLAAVVGAVEARALVVHGNREENAANRARSANLAHLGA